MICWIHGELKMIHHWFTLDSHKISKFSSNDVSKDFRKFFHATFEAIIGLKLWLRSFWSTFSFLKGRVTCLLLLGLVNVWRIWYATGLEFHSCTTVGNVSGCLWYRLSCHQEICGWSDQETVGWCQNRHQVGAPGAKAGHPMEAPGGSLWSPTLLLLSPKSVLCISLYLGATGTCPMPAARCHYRPLLTRAS